MFFFVKHCLCLKVVFDDGGNVDQVIHSALISFTIVNIFNDYRNFKLFINDLKLIFINAQISYGKGTIVDFLAEEILNYIAKVENEIHSTPLEIWHKNLIKIQTKIDKHMKSIPTDFQPPISNK